MQEINELIEAAKNRNLLLFVGAGVSMSLGLPSWTQLMSEVANDLGYDKDVFNSFGDNLVLAEYYKIKKNSIGPLRSKMDVSWHRPDIDISKSEIHELIVKLAPSLIYTTNYDRWIERAFDVYKKEYVKIANVADISKVKDQVTQIIKLHGDFDDDNSIVLTESSYFERLSFESPLDIKLRSDILSKSILFVGYGLNDINIRYLLYKLTRMWEAANCSNVRPKSYIFLNRPNPVQEEVLATRGIKAIVSDDDEPSLGLGKLLKKIVDGIE